MMFLPYLSAESKNTVKEDQTNERFKEAQGWDRGGQAKSFLRTVTVSGAGVLCSQTPRLCA